MSNELNGNQSGAANSNIGFSGTQSGMSWNQKANLVQFFRMYRCITFVHGDCTGADAEAHKIAEKYFETLLANKETIEPRIVVHPALNPMKRAYTLGRKHEFLVGDFLLDGICYEQVAPQKYLDRNKHIVDATDILLACPKEQEMTMRSGTWATIRYAWSQVQRTGKKVIVIPPKGRIIEISE